MSGLQNSGPPVKIGAAARVQTTPLKHNSPLPTPAGAAAKGRSGPAAAHTLGSISQYPDGKPVGAVRTVKVAAGEDPLSSNLFPRKPPAPPTPQQQSVAPPTAITPIQPSVTPPPKPAKVDFDPVIDMTQKFLSTVRKQPLDTTSAKQDIESLRALCESSAWKAVVDLSEFVLHANSLDSTHDCITSTLKNMSGYFGSKDTDTGPLNEAAKLRFEGLFRMKCFEDLSQEASDVLHIEEKRQGAKGALTDTIIAMRLILTEVKACTRKGEEAIQELALLRDEIRRHEEHGTVAVAGSWKWRVTWALISTSLRGGLTSVGMKLLLECHEELGELKQRQAGTDNPALSVLRIEEAQLVVLCRLSRTLLQSGALKAGIGYCDMIVERLGMLSKYEQTEGGAPILARMTAQMNFARAVALFGISNFEEAMSLFESIIQAGGQDQEVGGAEGASLRASPSRSSNQEFPSLLEGLIHAEESLVSMSVNNYAVCALYVKRVRESIDTLERLVQRDPARFLIDPVVFNLCTLYDLSCSPELSVRKKKMLQRVAATFNIHEPLLNAKSFRLT